MQDAREVRTKRAKTFTTWFFPVGAISGKSSSIGSPTFATKRALAPTSRFSRSPRSNPTATRNSGPFRSIVRPGERESVRAVFRELCARAGLPYFNPHSFRNTLVQLAYDRRLRRRRSRLGRRTSGMKAA